MDNLSRLAFLLGGWANLLPTLWRKRVYQTVKVLSGLATAALLVLPLLPGLGVQFTASTAVTAALTASLTLLGHLADRNTQVDPQVDVTPAPESGNPTPPPAPPAPPASS